jgi:hypothetical protein
MTLACMGRFLSRGCPKGRQAREEAAFIGVQTILGGLVALLILGAVTALAIVGLGLGAYFVAARRYILALIALVPSLLVGSFAASGWFRLLRSPQNGTW